MKTIKILIISVLFFQNQMNAQTQSKISFGGNVDYHIGTSAQLKSDSPLLFFKSGQSAGLNLSYIPKKGTTRFNLYFDYITGTNDDKAVATFAKENNIEYTKFSYTKSNPSGFSVMLSPKFMLFPKSENKKLPLMWLDLKAGVMLNNQQNLQFFLGQSTPSQEIKSNSMNFVYNPTLIVNVLKTKKMFVNLKASYSNFGGFGFGVNITEVDCRGAICVRCPMVGCCPDWCPKPEETKPKGK